MSKIGIRARIFGRVQQVGFRYQTQQQARTLGINGYARNLDDGSVEVFAWGEQGRVETLMNWLETNGPAGARIDKILAEPHQVEFVPVGFTTG